MHDWVASAGCLPNKNPGCASDMDLMLLCTTCMHKKAKISSIDNYRPVAIASVVSKVVERILLDRLSEYLDTMGNQFGFKPKLGTDMCIYSLKEIIGSYSQLNGCVFSCFWMLLKLLTGSNTLCYLLNC